MRTGESGAGNSVVERLGLRLRGGRGSQGCLDFGGVGGMREQLDLLTDGATQVVKGLADIGRVVVCFVGILGAASVNQWVL